jgi:adenine C2-methylase RlmN of 23S rRNA A2503 and tRNA A37
VWEWLSRGAESYQQMTNLPMSLRATLAEQVPLSCLTLTGQAKSSDGTVKALFHTADRRPLEAVLMRYRDGRRSICLSSQSGCPLTCAFCATGAMRFGRNLTASEILDQALHFRRLQCNEEKRPLGRALDGFSQPASQADCTTDRGSPQTAPQANDPTNCGSPQTAPQANDPTNCGSPQTAPQADRLTNCVFMGMGEPMMNLDAVLSACERLPHIGISHRKITISTVGWIPGIEAFTQQPLPLRLALSLHAAEEDLRSELMPVNLRYPLREVIAACEAFYARHKRRVFVEYVMLAGVNDHYQQALLLANLLRAAVGANQETIFKVNLIPWNPVDLEPAAAPDSQPAAAPDLQPAAEGSSQPAAAPDSQPAAEPGPPALQHFAGSSREAIAAFKTVLIQRGIPATVRLTRGRDIDAACGQLAARARPPQLVSPVAVR